MSTVTDNLEQMSRKLAVHAALDQAFSADYDLLRLPALMSEIGSRIIGCEFISMWLYDPSDNAIVNIVARHKIQRDAGEGQEVPPGRIRLAVESGEGKGVIVNLAAEILAGRSFEEMDRGAYIINDRHADPRISYNLHQDMDLEGIDNEIYAPMIFNGFKGFLCALNNERGEFTYPDWEILKILASKGAIVVDNMEARRRAEESSRMAVLGKALDLVRHELAAPLTAIKGASSIIVSMLENGPPSPAQMMTVLELARIIPPEVDRNVQTLQEIREYAKPRLTLKLSEGDINQFLRDSLEAIRDSMGGGKERTALHLSLQEGLPAVSFSGHHIMAVLRNLVRNSADRGSRRVDIASGKCSGEDGDCVELTVSDSGGGVDEDRLPALFHPYETTRSHAGGSGLGLFICRRLIEEGHFGKIEAQNIYVGEERRGLCVSIRLPL